MIETINSGTEPTIRCLWIAREIPFPENTGDRIYSSRLAQSLAEAGIDVSFVGFSASRGTSIPAWNRLTWLSVEGKRKPYWRALLSSLPLVAEAHATVPMRARVRSLLRESWDVIVLDNYATVWALAESLKYARARSHPTPIVYVSHNFEEGLAISLHRAYNGSWLRRLILLMNSRRIRTWERRLLGNAALVTTITDEDRASFAAISKGSEFLVLTPGHSAASSPARHLTEDTPRRVVIVGSFRWVVKQQNLVNLLNCADAKFDQEGISLDVVGDVPSELIDQFAGRLRSTTFHGFVKDIQPTLDCARMALVPEIIGGGFKLKFLDYIFGRVPVATIRDASAGIPGEVRQYFLQSDDIDGLVNHVIANIDKVDLLDELQSKAFDAAASLFNWVDRGVLLAREINRCVEQAR